MDVLIELGALSYILPRSNFVGTSFVAYGEGSRPTTSPTRNSKSSEEMREELVAIQYVSENEGLCSISMSSVYIPASCICCS